MPSSENEGFHRCKKCGVKMLEGYCIGGGEEYFCNDHEPPYFLKLYEEGMEDGTGDTYWTTWEEGDIE